ncbi:hypothetical protein ASC58_01025 [Phycicoccus sp. Root101]|nr:hypothetical protein ASC58_01025 [Phycicoccus sp. Root101]
MGVVPDALLRACDGHVTEASDDDTVLGMAPRWVASPATTAEVSAVMSAASASGLAVVPRGSGTKLRWGNAPRRLDVVLDTTRLDRLVEHAAGDLILVTGAGRPLATLQEDLAGSAQRLGIDPTRSGTIGGTVATGTSGPMRLRHGAVRDLVIGMTLVRADGVVAKSGGKVVKNVAGYDLAKLLTGSFGTLGVITEVAFRLHPVPGERRWVTVSVDGPDAAQDAVQSLVHSQQVPVAVEVDWDGATGTVAALLEGHAEATEECAATVAQELGDGAHVSGSAPPWWGEDLEREGPRDRGSGRTLVRVTHEIAGAGRLLRATGDLRERCGVLASYRGSPAVGVGCAVLDGEATTVVAAVDHLRATAAALGGAVVVLEAPDAVRDRLDVWGPATALDLMRSVKQRFDPGGVLAPGRFVGGI